MNKTNVLKIMVIARNENTADSIVSLLDELGATIVSYTDEQQVKKADLSSFDIMIVSTPLSTEFGMNLVADIYKKMTGGIIVLTKSDVADELQAKLRFTGAYVLGRPFNKSTLIQTIRFAQVAKYNIQKLEEENKTLNQKIIDMKIVDRAKYCLMEYLNMSESQAHRHIQKQAMDLRLTQKEVAEDILRTYNNGSANKEVFNI